MMSRNTALRAGMAFLMFVLGSLQAWDSNVHGAGLLIVLLVSLAIPLPGLFLILVPGAMGLIFTGMVKQER